MKFFNKIPYLNQLPKFILLFLLVDIALFLLHFASYLLTVPGSDWCSFMNLNSEFSLASWFASVQHFFVFILSGIFVYHAIKKRQASMLLIGLPLMFLFFSIDETVQLHELIGGALSNHFLPNITGDGALLPKTGAWFLILGIPFMICFAIYAYIIKKEFLYNRGSFLKLVLGLAVMMTGAIGLEGLSNFVSWKIWLLVMPTEELFEMIGSTIMLWSMYELSAKHLKHILNTEYTVLTK
jgi:hypothetical protein